MAYVIIIIILLDFFFCIVNWSAGIYTTKSARSITYCIMKIYYQCTCICMSFITHLLFLIPILDEDLHVPSVRGAAVERLGRENTPPHHLRKVGIF